MARIASKIFNDSADMTPEVKERLQDLQFKAGGINPGTGQGEVFGGNYVLSNKTPFVRMWTAVRVTKPTDDVTEIPIDDNIKVKNFDFENNSYEFPKKTTNSKYEKFGLSSVTQTRLEKFPESGYKIYQLGGEQVKDSSPNSSQGENETSKIGDLLLKNQKSDYETNVGTSLGDNQLLGVMYGNNKSLRPPAGITGVTSTTQNAFGPVAGILKTEVNFTVYDFNEYDMIFSKYFMRPAAKVFVDFGYTDVEGFKLYNPEEYVLDPTNFNEKIYGPGGQLEQSKYGMQFIQGQVTKFSSTIDPATGAYKCTISLTSKNMQLFDANMVDDTIGNIKQNMLNNIEFRVIELAASTLFPNNSNIVQADKFSTDEAQEYQATADIFAAEFLSEDTNNVPTKLNTELGIFWKGTFVKDKENEKKKIPQTGEDALYLSYGFIEDVIFNSEVGKYTSSDNQFLDTDSTEFDSSESYTTFDDALFDRQRFLKSTKQLPFLFPEEWEDTYNTRKKKSPGFFNVKTGAYKEKFPEEGIGPIKTKTMYDKRQGKRIPIREVFIKLSVIKQAIKQADSMTEVFNYLFKVMAASTGYQWDWHLNTNTMNNTTCCVVDKNFNPKNYYDDTKKQLQEIDSLSYFQQMFVFSPYAPGTLVKGMDLNLSQGDGSAISSKLALQSLGSAGRSLFPATELIDSTQTQMAVEDLQNDGKYKSIFNVEYYPPSDGISEMEKIFASLESDDITIADPDYLSSEVIYGTSNTKFAVPEAANAEYIKKVSLLEEKKALRGDVKPSHIPTKDFKAHKAVLENSGFEFSNTPYEYFTKEYFRISVKTRPTILPIKLGLTLYGFTGLQPSDKFRINSIPRRYQNFVFFQIMRITHTIAPGTFTTQLECAMRMRDDVKEKLPISGTDVANVMTPHSLKNIHKLVDVDKILPFLSHIEPAVDQQDQFNELIVKTNLDVENLTIDNLADIDASGEPLDISNIRADIMEGDTEGAERQLKIFQAKARTKVDYCYRIKTLPELPEGGKSYLCKNLFTQVLAKDDDDGNTDEWYMFERRFGMGWLIGPSKPEVLEDENGDKSVGIRFDFKPDTQYLLLVVGDKFIIDNLYRDKQEALKVARYLLTSDVILE